MRALAICSIIAVTVACAPDNEAAEADAGAVTDSVAQRADSTAARVDADSVAGTDAKDVSVTSTSAAVIGDSVLRRDSIIGRDSAFGPRYRIDSTGKLVPIRRP